MLLLSLPQRLELGRGFLYDALVLHHTPSKVNPANTLTASEDEGRFRRSLAMIAGLCVNDKNELVDLFTTI